MLQNQIVYVGCSDVPESRRKAAEKRYNMNLRMSTSKMYTDTEQARKRETAEIDKHWITVFNLARKSCVPSKHVETKLNKSKSAKARGAPMYATIVAIEVNRGKHMTTRARKHLSSVLKGRPSKLKGTSFTEEHCAKIGEANRRRLIHPGTGQPMPTGTKKVLDIWNQYQSVVAKQKRGESMNSKDKEVIKTWETRPAPVKIRKDRNKDRVSLLQSGWGHPWRLETLDQQTRTLVENH